LRALSTRAQITATSFTNSYEWGDFKGDSAQLMDRWFDLHLYLANWGTRRLMIRLPRRLVDRQRLDALLREVDCAGLRVSGENLVLDIHDEVELDDWDDGSGWLTALAPLRADVLAGDLRLFYLLWLIAVEADVFLLDESEPLPGIGPLTGALEAFRDFFHVHADLVEAAAERPAAIAVGTPSSEGAREIIAAMADREKTDMLMRLFNGDPHVTAELWVLVRERLISPADGPPAAARTVGELRSRAEAIGLARERMQAEKAAAERQRRAEEAEKARRRRLDADRTAGAMAFGARSRPRSSVATPPAMTRRRAFSSTCGRSPRSAARCRTSPVASGRFASGMPGRSGSSNGWRELDSSVRHGIDLAGCGRNHDHEHSLHAVAHRDVGFCPCGGCGPYPCLSRRPGRTLEPLEPRRSQGRFSRWRSHDIRQRRLRESGDERTPGQMR
jgi:hypothetical protein